MDSGLTIRPNGVVTQSSSERPDIGRVRSAVRTELSSAQSVTAASKAAETRPDDTSHVRKIILDAHSREVVYHALDSGSARVIRQTPEEATLRLRAYARALANRSKPNRPRARGDLDVEA